GCRWKMAPGHRLLAPAGAASVVISAHDESRLKPLLRGLAGALGSPAKVLQLLMSPLAIPVLNHFTRCAEVPWVKVSGITLPRVSFCKVSSPTALAALSADSTSPGFSQARRCCVRFAHTPAKQSACNSCRTDRPSAPSIG